MASPNDIEVMLHFYATTTPHPRMDAPAVSDAVARFVEAGLLISTPEKNNGYEVTEGGRLWVIMLCATPYPEHKWIDPREVQDA